MAVLAGAVVAAGCGPTEFSPAAFKAAHAETSRSGTPDDAYEALEDQARAAVDERKLIGRSPPKVRALLGAPDRRHRRGRLLAWSLGTIDDTMGPGDAGALYVQFDPGRRRVVSAKVGTRP